MMIPMRPPVGWRHKIAAAFTEHLALKASAILLAIVLWFVVGAREPAFEVVGVRFAPELDSGLVLRDPTPMIRAQVIGRPSEILKLASDPLTIRRRIAADAPDTLVLSLRSSDVEVPEGVEVIVNEVQPRELTLRFEVTTRHVVPVRSALVVRAPDSLPPLAVRLNPESVTVLGPRQLVSRVRFISTAADTIVYDTLPHLVDLDTLGLGVTVRPIQVKASFPRRRP